MNIETIHVVDLEELDRIIEDFSTDRIIYEIIPQQLHIGWDVHIFYDNILKGGEKHDIV
ncbi:MAG: hypothetical protein NC177_07595 [Ruminococcus flavefaciens]|nr:hypothetical protein [Ruminococcus flavefaciens]